MKTKRLKQLKFLRIIYLISGIFMIISGLLLMLVSMVYVAFLIIGIIIIYYSIQCKKKIAQAEKECNATNTVSISKNNIPKTEHHNIAGTSFRQKEIKSLGIENNDYSLSKKEIIEYGLEDENIYQLIFSPTLIQLVEEPENKHDPNAVKVIADNIHIGYIKKGSCSHIKNLINNNKINRITANIHGGKYKRVSSDYDIYSGKESFELEHGKTDFFASLDLELKSNI